MIGTSPDYQSHAFQRRPVYQFVTKKNWQSTHGNSDSEDWNEIIWADELLQEKSWICNCGSCLLYTYGLTRSIPQWWMIGTAQPLTMNLMLSNAGLFINSTPRRDDNRHTGIMCWNSPMWEMLAEGANSFHFRRRKLQRLDNDHLATVDIDVQAQLFNWLHWFQD